MTPAATSAGTGGAGAAGGADGKRRVAVVGGTGYGGMELLRLLVGHPQVEVTTITSRSESGPVGDVHGHLRGFTELEFTNVAPLELAADHDAVFFAAPHGVAAQAAPALLETNPALKIIDLSGDFRLATGALYAEHYGREHPHPEWLGKATYGAAECGRREELRGARLVANPGCHAIATLLALWPAHRAGLITGRVGVASVTGSSGSGASPSRTTHHPERFGNFKAYRPLFHQHVPEITGALSGDVEVDFVPHSAPLARGIHVTAFVPVGAAGADEVAAAYDDAYANEPFVRRVPGAEVRAVAGSNLADVAVTAAPGLAVVTVAIDNLGKGMAGTAVQNLNLVLGLPETAGLDRPGPGL